MVKKMGPVGRFYDERDKSDGGKKKKKKPNKNTHCDDKRFYKILHACKRLINSDPCSLFISNLVSEITYKIPHE